MGNRIDETAIVANVIDEELLGIKRFIDVTEDISAKQIDLYETIEFKENTPDYDGPYEVIPKMHDQTLETKRKMLAEDIHVLEIPSYVTSNEHGYSFIIGDE